MAAVPTNVKEKDVFHLTLEEYLHSLISLIEELVCHTMVLETETLSSWLTKQILL